jgi:hypothetical protein
VQGASVVVAAANALKSSGHSLFAANEGATPDIPRWDRVSGWIEIGAAGATQYDIAVQLLTKIVGPGQRWYVRFKLSALTADLVPGNVQVYAGLWHKTASSEGWVGGTAFNISHQIIGLPGTQTIEYRVLAKTDSGLSMLSSVLTITNAPNTLSTTNYIKLFYGAGPGFIEFQIFKKVGTAYSQVAVIRNSTDLQYNDVGRPGTPQTGWPSASYAAPLAYAQSRNVLIAPLGQTWSGNDLTIDIPSTYDYSQTLNEQQFLRFGLTAPTAVARQIGMDRVWFSMSFNTWAPDALKLPDGTTPVPSISPTSGNQGGGGPVYLPPDGGSGRPTCIRANLPVLLWRQDRRRRNFIPFNETEVGQRVVGDRKDPYEILRKRFGTASEYLMFRTKNGIVYECTADHRICVNVEERLFRRADSLAVGDRVATWVRGRIRMTEVTSRALVPEACEVGTYVLRHPGGEVDDGHGLYVAGRSYSEDRGVISSNIKMEFGEAY